LTEKSGWLDDFWALDLEKMTWSEILQRPGELKPCGRSMHELTTVEYNAKSQLLLFGGFGIDPGADTEEDDWEDCDDDIAQAAANQVAINFTRYNDTYLFDPTTKTWQFLHCEPSPNRRCAHKMVYNPETKKVHLFGGKGDTARLGDIWNFDLKQLSWEQQKSHENVAPRSFHSMCLGENGTVWVHGGMDMCNEHLSELQITTGDSIDTSVKLGNHGFFAFAKGKFYLFGGSSNFNGELGYCTTFGKTLHSGKLDNPAKKQKIEEKMEKASIQSPQKENLEPKNEEIEA